MLSIFLGLSVGTSALSQESKEIVVVKDELNSLLIKGCMLESTTSQKWDEYWMINRTSLRDVSCLVGDDMILCKRENASNDNSVYVGTVCKPGAKYAACKADPLPEDASESLTFPKLSGMNAYEVANKIEKYAASNCKNAAISDYSLVRKKFLQARKRAQASVDNQLKQSGYAGKNRITGTDGNKIFGTCASGNDFNGFYDDGRWTMMGGRNGMQFARDKDDAVSKVCD